MALQIWLPLTGDTKNRGVWNSASEFQISNTTFITVDNSGKLGKCYAFNSTATNPGIYHNDENFMVNHINNKSFSICAWIQTTATDTCVISLSYGVRIFVGNGAHTYISLYNSSRTVGCGANMATNDGKWHHVCGIYNVDTNKIQFYVDGIKKNEVSYTSGYTYASSWSNGLFVGRDPNNSTVSDHYHYRGKMNDVRVYDHALSPAEVAEIAKGLVCHYKLDNAGKGNDNLVSRTNTADTSRFGYSEQTGGSTKTIEYDNGTPCIKVTRNSTPHSGWAYMWNIGLATSLIKTSTTYTVSFDVIASGNGTVSFNGFMQGNATNNMSASTQVIQGSFNATSWSHIVLRTTTKDSFDGITIGSQVVYMGCWYLTNTEVWLMMKNMKVEEGATDTAWCPYLTDDKYVRLGFGSTTIADNSGLGNNGTKMGTLANSSDAPRYSSSTNFNNSGYIINSAFNLKSNAFTVNLWVNPRTASAQHFLFGSFSTWPNNGLGVYRDAGSIKYQCVLRSDGESSYSNKAMTVTLNTWNMLTVTYSGTVYTGYINGVKSFEVTYGADGIVSHYNIMIGNSKFNNTPASENEEAHVSDFRLYATCLSADDIKRLYEVSASVSKNGSMLGYEMKEG